MAGELLAEHHSALTQRSERREASKHEAEIESLAEALGPVIVQAQVRGAFVCLAALFLCRVNLELWIDYAGMALWAFVLSEALKAGRDYYVKKMQELIEHLEDDREISAHTCDRASCLFVSPCLCLCLSVSAFWSLRLWLWSLLLFHAPCLVTCTLCLCCVLACACNG